MPTPPLPTPAPTPLSQGLIDSFIDALWLEDGLSQNTLAAYRRDLTLALRNVIRQRGSAEPFLRTAQPAPITGKTGTSTFDIASRNRRIYQI
jgi:integrase/recombinase XerD